jgi:hypothetical protein
LADVVGDFNIGDIVVKGVYLERTNTLEDDVILMTADLEAEDHVHLYNIKLNFLEVGPGMASVDKRYLNFRISRSEYERMGPL